MQFFSGPICNIATKFHADKAKFHWISFPRRRWLFGDFRSHGEITGKLKYSAVEFGLYKAVRPSHQAGAFFKHFVCMTLGLFVLDSIINSRYNRYAAQIANECWYNNQVTRTAVMLHRPRICSLTLYRQQQKSIGKQCGCSCLRHFWRDTQFWPSFVFCLSLC